MGDVMFSYHGTSGPESSMTLFRRVHQVAVPVGRQTTAWLVEFFRVRRPGRSLLSMIALFMLMCFEQVGVVGDEDAITSRYVIMSFSLLLHIHKYDDDDNADASISLSNLSHVSEPRHRLAGKPA